MHPYQTLLEHYRALSTTWSAHDWDAHCALDAEGPRLTPDEVAEFVEDFCSRAGRHVEELGADSVGQMIWYLMGSGEQVWHTVRDSSPEYGTDAIRSLCLLYERCFAKHLPGWSGLGGHAPPLLSACHMLWDMDGGLLGIPLFGKPKILVPICYEVLEHALGLDSPECWASALHGLGHIVYSHKNPAQELIDSWLAGRGRSAPEDLKAYAHAARSGCIQ